MSKLLVVFGATGQQGGSVANFVLSDANLSKQYKVRGVTRDLDKPAAEALKAKGAELVKGDLDDESSIKSAVQGAHTVFIMTRTVYDEQAKAREIRQGKAAADAAVAAGAQQLVYSTECSADKVSNGKYPSDTYDSKNDVEHYIRKLPIKSAFFAPATFMQNLGGMMAPKPSPSGDGSYLISNIVNPDAKFPWLDVADDSGKFVGAILAEPEKYEGKVLAAAETQLRSLDEVAALISKNTGKDVKYYQMPVDKYKGYLPPVAAESIVNMFLYIQDCGYYGAETKDVVSWSAEQAKGKVTTLEDYFAKKPLVLA